IMADVNAPVEQAPALAPPTRTDEQILPRIRWVPIGKSNCYLDAEKSQSNPIYKIAVDILKHTNFFRAFTASSTIPAIYIQQFWDTICYDRTDGGYKCQLDEQWFNLTKDTLRDALQITPVNNNKAFSSPPTQDTLINFVNGLGYPKEVKHLSNVVTNDMFQPWRALTTIINLCLTGKTSGFERPRAPVLQILWGVINRAHIDYAERMISQIQCQRNQKKKKRHGSPKTPSGSPPHPPPPPPPPAGPSGTSGASGASGSSQSPPPPSNTQGGQSTGIDAPSSSKTAASAEYTAWTMTDTTIKLSISPIPEELHMGDDSTADEQAYSSSGEDVGRDHIPMVNLRQSWWKPIIEDRPATPEPAWSIPSSDLTVPTNNWASALKSTYTLPPENSLLAQIGLAYEIIKVSRRSASPVPYGRMPQTSHRSSGRCNPKVLLRSLRSPPEAEDLPRDNPLVSVEVLSIHNEDGNPARANVKQAIGLHKDGDADASFHFRNSDKYYHDPEECEYAGPKVTTSHEGNIPQQG
ncbi:hypothetical protein Tco_0454240, partial [Tanacetum coccineum]